MIIRLNSCNSCFLMLMLMLIPPEIETASRGHPQRIRGLVISHGRHACSAATPRQNRSTGRQKKVALGSRFFPQWAPSQNKKKPGTRCYSLDPSASSTWRKSSVHRKQSNYMTISIILDRDGPLQGWIAYALCLRV